MARRLAEIRRLDVSEALAGVELPVCALWSADDRLVPAAARSGLEAQRPGTRSVTVPGPHLLLQRHPDALFTALDALTP